jgi:hypothetical protein
VSVVTNALLRAQLLEIINKAGLNRDYLFFKCSFHYLELKRLNLLEKFFDNIDMIKAHQISFTVEMTVNDATIPYIQAIKEICQKRLGALCHIIESRNEKDERFNRLTQLSIEEHRSVWESFNSPLFAYQQKTFEIPVTTYCYGGDYSLRLDLQTGNLYPCNLPMPLDNLFAETNHLPNFTAVGSNCSLQNCFKRHVDSLLCGCFEDENAISYKAARDRKCSDGSVWLNDVISQSYQNKCAESHTPYSDSRMLFSNCLMRKVINDRDLNEKEVLLLARIIENELFNKNIYNIAIYGYGKIGKWLANILKFTKVETRFFIDRSVKQTDGGSPIYIAGDSFPDVDAVIITVLSDYSNAYSLIKEKISRIISVTQLVQ